MKLLRNLTLALVFMTSTHLISQNCDFPSFTENTDRNYVNGEIISRNGVDYKVLVSGWANTASSDWAYAPGTGTSWMSAWKVVNDPCQSSGVTNNSLWITKGPSLILDPSITNIGLGTQTPSSYLDINGFTKITASETLGNDVLQLRYPSLVNGRNHYTFFANRFFNATSMYSVIGAYSQDPNSTGTQEGPRPLILQPQELGGNLGIGYHSNEPSHRLSVMGDAYIKSNVGIGAESNSDVMLRVNGNKKVGFCVEHNYNSDWGYGVKLITSRNNTKAFGVFNNAIGEDVFLVTGNGTVYSTEVKVRMAGKFFPDYVFEDNYNLMSLDSLENYVASNNKLPNTPSAIEVQKNDLNLGELTLLQQEKIEELTLYILELKSRIEALEKKQ